MEFLTALYFAIMTLASVFCLSVFILGGVPIIMAWKKYKKLPNQITVNDGILYIATPLAGFFASIVAIIIPAVALI